jgi:hypothetical protein
MKDEVEAPKPAVEAGGTVALILGVLVILFFLFGVFMDLLKWLKIDY